MSGKLIVLIALVLGAVSPAAGAGAPPRATAPRAVSPRERAPYPPPRAYGGYPPAPYGGPVYAAPYGYPAGPRPGAPASDWRMQQEEARSGVRRGQFAPLGRVISSIRERTPGRQLDTGLEYQAGRAVYRVRWMTARGRRVDFLVDAASGAILGER